MDADGSVLMRRYWLFNPRTATGLRAMLPSIRIHHTMGRDRDPSLYNFPWNARTFVLRGWHEEERREPAFGHFWLVLPVGTTGRLQSGQHHRISEVSRGGVWTMYVMGRHRGTPYFLLQGMNIPGRHIGGSAASLEMSTAGKGDQDDDN